MTEMRRKKAERTAELPEAEGLPESHPSRPKRSMGVDYAFRVPRRPGSEQDQCGMIKDYRVTGERYQVGREIPVGNILGIQHLDSHVRKGPCGTLFGSPEPEGKTRLGCPRQRCDLKCR